MTNAILFVCPRCGGTRWGSNVQQAIGLCKQLACTFVWPRANDHRVMRLVLVPDTPDEWAALVTAKIEIRR